MHQMAINFIRPGNTKMLDKGLKALYRSINIDIEQKWGICIPLSKFQSEGKLCQQIERVPENL